MSPLQHVLRRAGHHGPLVDPVRALIHQVSRSPSERRAQALAREFYHAAALSGHPLVQGGVATFLYHAPRAREVYLAGEFNGWRSSAERMTRLASTGLYLLRRPIGAHTTYKFVVDGRWREDPANPLSLPDGHGGQNSLLFGESPSRLKVHPDFYSKALRNRRPLVIYLPPGYDASPERYPVLYIMDGRENLERGHLPALFDEEIQRGALPPFIAVFIPHKGRSRNYEYTPYFRRSRLDAYHRFVALELVPFIDSTFRTRAHRDARTLLGQSFGGTVVTSLAARAPHLFRHVLAQSGVYAWGRRRVTSLFTGLPRPDLRFYLDSVANRTEQWQSQLLVQTLRAYGYPHFYRAVPSRHEYEDWRDRVPDGLRYLWFGIHPE